jgi:hypothetical protein
MTSLIQFFAISGVSEFTIGEGEEELSLGFRREVGFDRDVDGHWIVWTVGRSRLGAENQLGSVVVTEPTVIAFIETLATLISQPNRFTHEPLISESSSD